VATTKVDSVNGSDAATEPGGRREPVLSPEALDELMAKVDANGLELLGPDGVLAGITKAVIERALDEERTHHLGYERGDPAGRGSGNSRNGAFPKTVLTEIGAVDIDVPRDRNGTFEPALIPNGATRLAGFNERIISLYASGMTTRDIRSHLGQIYGVEVSPDLISRVTDGIVEELNEWQNRPLDAVYPIVYIDALVVKVRDQGTVRNKAAYLAIGVDVDGRKHVLGVWMGDGDEGAKFWLNVLTEIRNRGVADVLIVCCDGLKGLPDAIEATWPRAVVQTCVHSPDPGGDPVLLLQGPQGCRQGAAADLHRRQRSGRRRSPRRPRARVGRPLPGHRPIVAGRLGTLHAVPRLPGPAPQDRVHHEFDRVDQLPATQGVQEPGPLPQRRRCPQAPAARRPGHHHHPRRGRRHRHLRLERSAEHP
jgi:hypothetical protein